MIEETNKLKLFSKFESELLEYQIKSKERLISELWNESANVLFFAIIIKKLKFYAVQGETKWQN